MYAKVVLAKLKHEAAHSNQGLEPVYVLKVLKYKLCVSCIYNHVAIEFFVKIS